MVRPWPDDRSRSVAQVFDEERPHLLALPDDRFPAEERVTVRVGKTPYVRFDANDYSVPHAHVQRDLVVLASVHRLRICAGQELVAEHERSYGKGQRIEDREHVEALVEVKRGARRQRGMGRLQVAAPSCNRLLQRAAERGLNLGNITSRLLELLDEYGAVELDAAVTEINSREVVHVQSVRQWLEQRRRASGRPPLSAVELPRAELRDLVVRPHALTTYDQLTNDEDGDE